MYKVLVLAYYFPPMGMSGVQRTLKFAKYMPEFNWSPTILTTGRTGYFAHDLSLLKEAESSGMRIIRTEAYDPASLLKRYGTIKIPRERIRKFLSSLSKTIFIPDNKVSWSWRAYKKAEELLAEEKFDIIYVSGPPFSSFMAAAKLKRKFNIPLVFDYRDLWVGNQYSFNPTVYHRAKHKALETECLRAADRVIAVNRNIKEKLLITYNFLKHEDVVIIPHGFDQEDFDKIKHSEPETANDRKIKILYSGIFYESITPVYFMKAFKSLTIERPDIAAKYELHFIGHLREANKKLFQKMGLNNYLHYHGYLEHKEAVRKLMESDVLWLMLGNKQAMENVTAGKMFEYIGARKPILACLPDGVSKQIIREYQAGFITPPDDIHAIKDAFIEIYERFMNNSLPVPKEEFVNKYNRKYLTEQLVRNFQFFIKEI